MTPPWRQLRYWMTSRRLGLFLCMVGFVWGLALMNMTLVGYNEPDSDHIKGEILQLSEKYVKALAKETENTIDGPYTGRFTGYDLKKTMAVLLQNIMERLTRLEHRMDEAVANGTLAAANRRDLAEVHDQVRQLPGLQQQRQPPLQAEQKTPVQSMMDRPVDVKGLILGQQEKCELEEDEAKRFQHCRGKINWMKAHWKSDPCYKEYGVDGSDCSFRMYLSEVERWCPPIPGRATKNHTEKANKYAQINLDSRGLMARLQDPGQRRNYQWIRMRIERMWSRWTNAAVNLAAKQDLTKRKQKKVILHLGLLSRASGMDFVTYADRGGPLGELVQWSDIISALYILGHDLTITSEVEQLQAMLAKFPSAEAQCQSREKLPLHMIFTDIVGLTQFKRKVKNGYGKFSCLLRIIDSFGTEPAFNFDTYAKTHHLKTQWGMQNLNPQQFYTMFPHSPDNSFMGFVVENHINDSSVNDVPRQNQAVVYGKAQYMWQGKERYLNIIKEYAEIHGTTFVDQKDKTKIPSFVRNHGILKGPELHGLLRASKLFIGLGFPYEGPAPLEAIAQGCVFINPKFTPPHSSINTPFFKGKPTRRKVTSQHPYAEVFIGEPHVYTVDISNEEEVRRAIVSALKAHNDSRIAPYLPYEYTEEGMLQRLNAYLEHQDFCSPFSPDWPPPSALSFLLSDVGQSCKDTCMKQHMVCEPSSFRHLNTQQEIEKLVGSCSSVIKVDDIYFPAFNPVKKQCVLQNQHLLFSCVGEHNNYQRVCPCRNFMHGQIALCKDCSAPGQS